MTEFLTPTDIGNRALQHCGVPLLDPVLGFAENSQRAQQVGFVYGKVRRAELRRNLWAFATKEAMLRAIDSNTLLVSPSLWSSSLTYFIGSIVADQIGTLWKSRIPNNTGNQPGVISFAWEPYFGPLTVSLYDSSIGYFAGELVYTAAGDGTYNVYASLANSNAVHPGLSNEWAVSTVYMQNQVVQVFPAWSSGTTYAAGGTVIYTDGNTYASLVAGNLNNIPTSTLGTKWALVPVLALQTQTVPIISTVTPIAITPVAEWLQGTGYSIGNVVMFNATEYVSLINNNTGNFPNAPASTSWAALTGGTLYMSLINLNLNNPPGNSPAAWSASTTYAANAQVMGTDGFTYTSIGSGNLNHNPVADAGVHWTNTGVLTPWTTVFTQGGGNSQWMQVGGSASPAGVGLSMLPVTYPIGTGPVSQPSTANLYRLPGNYLRVAPQDPKAGGTSVLGAPSELFYKDWKFENQFLVSREVAPIFFRFIADTTDVTAFDDMFCEGLAARIAEEVMETLTQSTAKLQMVRTIYEKLMTEARLVSGIETGAEEPAMDDFLAVRY